MFIFGAEAGLSQIRKLTLETYGAMKAALDDHRGPDRRARHRPPEDDFGRS